MSFIQEEIESRLKSGNACYYFVQHLLSSSLLSKNLKIKIDITIILSLVSYEFETWSLTLRKERRLRVTENRVPRRILAETYLDLEGMREQRSGEDYITRNFTICTPHQMLFG